MSLRLLALASSLLIALPLSQVQWRGQAQVQASDESIDTPSRTTASERTPRFIGRAGCSAATCHGSVVARGPAWRWSATRWEGNDPHRLAGVRLQSPAARQILQHLEPTAALDTAGYERILAERCVSCHAPESIEADSLSHQLARGVGCEACHGPAEQYQSLHTLARWVNVREKTQTHGMSNTEDFLERLDNCARCHVGSRAKDEPVRDVTHDLIAAGHPRLQFDPKVMESRLPVHWSTDPESPMSRAAQDTTSEPTARQRIGELFARLKAARRLASVAQPEFSEFDCQACHHWPADVDRRGRP